MDTNELAYRLRFGNTDSETMNGAADLIEQQAAELERLRAVASEVPTNWLHPLLTGPKAVPGLDRCDSRVIEELLRRVRDEVRAAIDAARGE